MKQLEGKTEPQLQKRGEKKKGGKGLGCGGWGLGGGRGLCLGPTGPEKALGGGGWGLGSMQQEGPRSASGLGERRARSGTPAGSLDLSGQGKC